MVHILLFEKQTWNLKENCRDKQLLQQAMIYMGKTWYGGFLTLFGKEVMWLLSACQK